MKDDRSDLKGVVSPENVAHIRQSSLDSGLGSQAKVNLLVPGPLAYIPYPTDSFVTANAQVCRRANVWGYNSM